MTYKNISILGSTGSVGVSALDVCRRHPDRFRVVALAAGQNGEALLQQTLEFQPDLVSVNSAEQYNFLKSRIPAHTQLLCGNEGLTAIATCPQAHVVLSAIVGAAGLKPTMAAISAGKSVALANKESMVIAGELMSALARKQGVQILPVDSEHSAIFQCLNGESINDVVNLTLTASGGPFFQTPAQDFAHITKAQALKHPNWDMGAKITIDSATMMNKGLEIIEAHYLFNMPIEKIKVVVHPQSTIHSLVEFVDGSVMAQMGEPDMRVPIAYALSYPRRIATGTKALSLPNKQQLTFFEPDFEKFKCLRLAREVARQGGSYCAVLNAANEVAVDLFLKDRIPFIAIASLVEKTLDTHQSFRVECLDDVFKADSWARAFAANNL